MSTLADRVVALLGSIATEIARLVPGWVTASTKW